MQYLEKWQCCAFTRTHFSFHYFKRLFISSCLKNNVKPYLCFVYESYWIFKAPKILFLMVLVLLIFVSYQKYKTCLTGFIVLYFFHEIFEFSESVLLYKTFCKFFGSLVSPRRFICQIARLT